MKILQTDGSVLEGSPVELAEFVSLFTGDKTPAKPEPEPEPVEKPIKIRIRPKGKRVASSKVDAQIEKAMDYFVKHKVSLKRALIKFLSRKNNVGGTDYKRAREVLYKKYPRIADALLEERSNVRHRKYQKDRPVKKRKKKYRKSKPDDLRRVRFKTIHLRIKELRDKGMNRADAKRNAEREWREGLLDKLKSEFYKKEFVEKAKKVLKEQKKKEVQTQIKSEPVEKPEPVEQQKPAEAKPEIIESEESKFPLIYPISEDEVNKLIEQIKYVLKNNLPLRLSNVSQIKLVLGKEWSESTFQKFLEYALMNSKAISEYLGIPNKFFIDKEDGEYVLKYRGEVV